MMFRRLRQWLWHQDIYLWSTCPWCENKLITKGFDGWMECPNHCGEPNANKGVSVSAEYGGENIKRTPFMRGEKQDKRRDITKP
jgi:hypothetical protein